MVLAVKKLIMEQLDKRKIKFRIVEHQYDNGSKSFTPEWYCYIKQACNFGWNPCYGSNLTAETDTHEQALKNIIFFAGCIGLFVSKPKEIIHEINIGNLFDINKDCRKTPDIEKTDEILAELKLRKRRNLMNRALNNNASEFAYSEIEITVLNDLIKYVQDLINSK